ncbi:mechanosensitive ion channel [Lichenicola cladoniae]|uniref:Mechanosensitive ion channel n=1 Tax=Lichenicola cladoniae TaxID=1484109 RepID=A0A6M8HUL6_9PROT|nr:mechanosensitive ion channel domain-containing protein [Lichenicola cladoniae]NPD68266.1 mechanosensitive ion channel [Acetobacteraceae bacterium]QKE91867.1 mechanosensitive ion channel [Lichenicola cladoniae]
MKQLRTGGRFSDPASCMLLVALVVAQIVLCPAVGHAQTGPAMQASPSTGATADEPAADTGQERPDSTRGSADATGGTAPADGSDALTPAERQRLKILLAQPHRRDPAPSSHPASDPKAVATTAKPAPTTATPAVPEKPKVVTLAPDSLAGEMLAQAATVQKVLQARSRNFNMMFGDMALAGRWLHREMVVPSARAALLDALWRGAAVVLVGLAVEHLLLLALRRPLRGLGRDARAAEEEHVEAAHVEELAAIESSVPSPEDSVASGLNPATAVATLVPQLDGALPGTPAEPATPVPEAVDPALRAEAAQRSAKQAETRSLDAVHRRRTLRLFRRLPYAVLRLVLKLAPLAVFLALGNLAATTVATQPKTQLVIVTVTNIYGVGRVLWLLADMILAPKAPGVRLLRIENDSARFLTRWWSWLVAIPVVAICFTDIGRILDLPTRPSQAITRAVILIEHVLLAVLIWQTRHKVAAALHPPRRLRERSFGRILVRLADYWWIAALFFDGALWVVWAAQIRGGYAKMWQLFLSSVIVIVVCRLVGIMLLGGLARAFRVDAEAGAEAGAGHTGVEHRASRYYPAMRRIVTWSLFIIGAVALAQAWGIPAIGFFTHGTLGTHLLSASTTILVSLIVGVVVWELVNGALDRQISRFSNSGQVPRAVRLQTLLPILRTLLFVVLGTILVLTILSEIGLNIAPLLAGAGIIGVAVGFGSQKLVQDFITGIFLLVENAMQVGDNVTVAGISGVVEHLSIRTLRLRSGDGSIQIIPFSSVSTVANLSRDYAVAAITVSIAFSEDTDRLCDLLNDIGHELRTDAVFAEMTLADFGLNGVDSLGEYAVTISGTIRCTVGGRWPIQREFNRRLRRRMAELDIALPQAQRSISMPKLAALLAEHAIPPNPTAPHAVPPAADAGNHQANPDTRHE